MARPGYRMTNFTFLLVLLQVFVRASEFCSENEEYAGDAVSAVEYDEEYFYDSDASESEYFSQAKASSSNYEKIETILSGASYSALPVTVVDAIRASIIETVDELDNGKERVDLISKASKFATDADLIFCAKEFEYMKAFCDAFVKFGFVSEAEHESALFSLKNLMDFRNDEAFSNPPYSGLSPELARIIKRNSLRLIADISSNSTSYIYLVLNSNVASFVSETGIENSYSKIFLSLLFLKVCHESGIISEEIYHHAFDVLLEGMRIYHDHRLDEAEVTQFFEGIVEMVYLGYIPEAKLLIQHISKNESLFVLFDMFTRSENAEMIHFLVDDVQIFKLDNVRLKRKEQSLELLLPCPFIFENLALLDLFVDRKLFNYCKKELCTQLIDTSYVRAAGSVEWEDFIQNSLIPCVASHRRELESYSAKAYAMGTSGPFIIREDIIALRSFREFLGKETYSSSFATPKVKAVRLPESMINNILTAFSFEDSKLLIESAPENFDGISLLNDCVKAGRLDLIRYLIEGKDVMHTTPDTAYGKEHSVRSIFAATALAENLEIMQYLISPVCNLQAHCDRRDYLDFLKDWAYRSPSQEIYDFLKTLIDSLSH